MNLNESIAPNFRLREVVEWPRHQVMTTSDRAKATAWATEELTTAIAANARRIAAELQKVRDRVNAAHPEYKGRIAIRPVSWFRPVRWEEYRRRSGKSQHIHGHAVDFIVAGLDNTDDFNHLMEWIWKDLQNWPDGLARKVTGGRYAFIHVDLRGTRARWNY